MALEFTDNNFQNEVIDNKGLVLVDFWAEWCGPCRMIGPIIEELAKESTDVKIGKVNVDSNQNVAMKYGVRSIPTLLFLKDGEEVHRHVGVTSKAVLQQKIAELQ